MPTPDLSTPPLGSSLKIIDTDASRGVAGPPIGVLRGSFGMGLIGPLIVMVPLVILWRSGWSTGGMGPMLWVWLGLLASFGITLYLVGVDLGTASFRLTIQGSTLTLSRRSSIRSSKAEWALADIEDIALAEAPVTAGNKPLYRLKITGGGQEQTALLGRHEPELRWAVAVLSEQIKHAHQNAGSA